MAALLRNLWLNGAYALPIRDRASASVVREQVREKGRLLRLPAAAFESLAIVASELAANQLDHARWGEMVVREVMRFSEVGLEVVAIDQGQGIADCAAALRGDPAAARGGGLPAVLRLADEVDIEVRAYEGLCIRARKFAVPPPQRCDVGIFGRPVPGAQVCGDAAYVAHAADSLLCAVVDGAGHGAAARSAAFAVLDALRAEPRGGLAQLLTSADRVASATRGAALSLERLDLKSGQLDHACVGDVETRLVQGRALRRLTCTPGMLGDAAQMRAGRRIRMETEQLQAGTLTVIFTDGVQGRWDLESERVLQRQHPLLVAQHLVHHFSRDYDDALALVVRWGTPSAG